MGPSYSALNGNGLLQLVSYSFVGEISLIPASSSVPQAVIVSVREPTSTQHCPMAVCMCTLAHTHAHTLIGEYKMHGQTAP